jgi:hypothetical protein
MRIEEFLMDQHNHGRMKKRLKKKSIKPAEEGKKKETPQTEIETETKVDYGGLPERNLKKNLGC